MIEPPSMYALASRRVVTPDGLRPAAVVVAGPAISAVMPLDELPTGVAVEDLGDLVIAPGVVDSHVHINEPGRTDWEGFESATRAAAAGGVTTLVDMPLNSSPVTTTVAALNAKRAAAKGKCWVDVGFYGGLVPGNIADLEPLADAGVCGIKCFLCDSGLDEFPAAGELELRAALPILARRNLPLLVHAELVDENWPVPADVHTHRQWTASRPKTFELDAVRLMRTLCEEFQTPVHIVHLSSAVAAGLIAESTRTEVPLTVETCPHYLHFGDEELAHADPRFKCAPAIGDRGDREALWHGLIDGHIDSIGSDHSPCPPELKFLAERDFRRAWGGIASLELSLPIVWTGARERNIPLEQLSDWLAAAPAKLVGLSKQKGRIAAGYDADLAIWNPDTEWTVDAARLNHRHKLTPYDGVALFGRVERTYLRGRLVYEHGDFVGSPTGQLLQREN
jgi:allantoinase